MERARADLQRRLKREARRGFEPRFVVLETRALLVVADMSPQPPHTMGLAVQIQVNEGFPVHYFPLGVFCLLAPRMRCGRFSSSSCSPTGSFFGSTRSASRSAMPRTKRTVA